MHQIVRGRLVLSVFFMSAVLSCRGEPEDPPSADADLPDVEELDVRGPDAEAPDTDAPDTDAPDTDHPDTDPPDADPPEPLCGDPEVTTWEDSVIYYLKIDRFRDSSGTALPVPGATGDNGHGASAQYEGGDLQGVIDELPYLQGLGVNVLWISSPVYNRDVVGVGADPMDPHLYSAYHGTWPSPEAIDYDEPSGPVSTPSVEPRLGTAAELQELVGAVQGLGMRVIMDYAINHVDRESGLYQTNPGWFSDPSVRCTAADLPADPAAGTSCAFTDYLVPFDFSQAAPREWLLQDLLWWAREYHLDGIALRHSHHVPRSWIQELRGAASLEELILLGDIKDFADRFYDHGDVDLHDVFDGATFEEARAGLDSALDGLLNYPLRQVLCESVFGGQGVAALAEALEGAPGPSAGPRLVQWIGNAQVPRAIHLDGAMVDCSTRSELIHGFTAAFPQPGAQEAYEKLGLAFAALMTTPGFPLIYYGDEIGLSGGTEPDNRRMMPWSGLTADQVELRQEVAMLAQIRRENRVLSRGMLEVVEVNEAAGWLMYRATGCDEASPDLLIALNPTGAAVEIALPEGEFEDLRDGQALVSGAYPLGARGYMILRAL